MISYGGGAGDGGEGGGEGDDGDGEGGSELMMIAPRGRGWGAD